MSGGKQSPAMASSPICSLRGSIITLAILTLVSLTCFSLKSLYFPLAYSSSTSSSIPQPQVSEKMGAGDEEEEAVSDIYHSPEVFKLNYAKMERKFKVYIYPDGDPNTFYQTPRKLTGKYASEGYFFQNIRESRYVTQDPDQAHLFFIPISCHKMRGKVRALLL